ILFVFALEQVAGLQEHPVVAALRTGALDHGAVFVAGESWRLLPAAFVHFPLAGGPSPIVALLGLIPHVLLNGWALIQLGSFVEEVYGTARLVLVFLGTALVSSLASAWFEPAVSGGASGGIFGLIGFLLAARLLHGSRERA